MQVLVVGGGGREHALAWKISQSPLLKKLWLAPGNAGMAKLGERVPIQPTQIDALADFVHAKKIDLTVVGPETPLCLGLSDRLQKLGRRVFGPVREAAKLEGSKSWAKALCRQHNIPSPDFKVFHDLKPARDYLDRAGQFPLVVKADGLAAGKGVRVCQTRPEAEEHLRECFERSAFGDAGKKVVIEEFVKGSEVSVMVITDGKTLLVLDAARDYKRALDGDQGPNTGGMGSISPVQLGSDLDQRIEEKILVPTVHALAREGHPFQGLLYAGLMLTPTGPRVLEYNVRFGDPETQPTLARLRSDLLALLLAACDGKLEDAEIEWDPRYAVCVVLASGGYPGAHQTGFPISGLAEAEQVADALVFHAGTELKRDEVVTAGGRVLNVVGLGATMDAARERAYAAARKISFEGMTLRTDIGAGL